MCDDDLQYASLPTLSENKALRLDESQRVKDAKRFARTAEDEELIDLTAEEMKARRKLAKLEQKEAGVTDTATVEG